tara:strand:- start:77 stop:802 length:726 start_codon:yes stop_codon:yes gene_type:complete
MEDNSYRYIPFRSQQPMTPFAPQWSFFIGEKALDIDVDQLKDLVLEKEPEIMKIDHPYLNDGSTGLGTNTTTARYGFYNVLEWDHPQIDKIKVGVKEFHAKYLRDCVGVEPYNIKALCWVNIMRKGDRIKKHLHGLQPTTYLSGHVTISSNQTSTIYVNPFEHAVEEEILKRSESGKETVNQAFTQVIYPAENVPGNLTLFPSYIPHLTTEHKTDDERITLAFDLTPFDVQHKVEHRYIPL